MKPYYLYFFIACAITVVIYTSYRYYRSDCKMSEWTPCSVACGGGTQQRYRTITKYKNLDGKECPPFIETRTCNTKTVRSIVKYRIGLIGRHAMTCGGGQQMRSRTVTTPNMYGGDVCPPFPSIVKCQIGQNGQHVMQHAEQGK